MKPISIFFLSMIKFFYDKVQGGKEDTIYEKEIIAMDGEESRSSGRKDTNNGEVKVLQTFSVYSTDYGICLG